MYVTNRFTSTAVITKSTASPVAAVTFTLTLSFAIGNTFPYISTVFIRITFLPPKLISPALSPWIVVPSGFNIFEWDTILKKGLPIIPSVI